MRLMIKSALIGIALAAAIQPAARASISPNPTTETRATGIWVNRSELGTSTCNLANVSGTFTGTSGGASGAITAMTFTSCGGIYAAGSALASAANSINVTLTGGGGVTISNLNILMRNVLLGSCLYRGTLTGNWTSPTRAIRAEGQIGLVALLSGFCYNPIWISMQIVLGSASITNP